MPTITFRDKEADGALVCEGAQDGAVDYATGNLSVSPYASVLFKRPKYTDEVVGTKTTNNPDGGSTIVTEYKKVLSYEESTALYAWAETGAVTISYTKASGVGTPATETVTLSALEFDVTLGYAEQVVRGSLRATLGGMTLVDTAGQIYRDPSPATGAGTLAGSFDPTTGKVRLTSWLSGGTNAITLQALTTSVGSQPVDAVTFRTPVSPIKSGSLQLRWSDLTGTAYSKLIDGTGKLTDNDCEIDVDSERGIVRAHFGRWYIAADLTPEQMAESWYSVDRVVIVNEVEKIWRPRLASAETIVYNAVASSYLPPDSVLLGLDAARLPPDGKALIFARGNLVLTHHTGTVVAGSLTASQTIDCERTRLYRVVIEDSAGAYLGADQYTLNRELGTVTMSPDLDLTGLTAPFGIHHTIADLSRVVDTDISGTLTMMSAISHDYPDGSYCSGVLFVGTLQARVSNLFAQSSWTSVWSDALIGTSPLAQYNDAMYPIIVKNEGAYPDRILIRFTGTTAFQIIGENLGLIGVGETFTDCSPVNSLTGLPYFTIDLRGWGAGWATGNCLRFNLHAASYPIDLVRAVQPSQPSGQADGVSLLFIGNTDHA
jgi:hypothetical protein